MINNSEFYCCSVLLLETKLKLNTEFISYTRWASSENCAFGSVIQNWMASFLSARQLMSHRRTSHRVTRNNKRKDRRNDPRCSIRQKNRKVSKTFVYLQSYYSFLCTAKCVSMFWKKKFLDEVWKSFLHMSWSHELVLHIPASIHAYMQVGLTWVLLMYRSYIMDESYICDTSIL